ncbi:molybdate ABC transporter substrate-binding protein [uncultured Bartonella sp.]|uniref:molybdate ABC transporter substrate-binding protein n=1 Tax=uncultured Bartonella sp. TaxID=104108 RepID=UPI002639C619|nr:molybdate ABC transporter substrate-binding protein [uncultured Bartonella sp.]
MKFKIALSLSIFLAGVNFAHAGETVVAVAANFTDPVKEIAEQFKEKTGHGATLSFGATGNFYQQIKNGAPFEVFLAADTERPTKAVEEGYAVKGTEFTYAIGTLVLWSAKEGLVKGPETLTDSNITHISYCNPDAAPYGKASVETMDALKVHDRIKDKLVEGQNISQAYQFVKTGNAEIGFVALSQIINEKGGSKWVVPQNYYNPIRQDAVLLKTGENNEAAKAFIEFLKGPEAATIIKKYGYALLETK